MGKKINIKHNRKNSASEKSSAVKLPPATASSQPDLLSSSGGKPIPALKTFVSAQQLFSITGLDDPALRRLCNPNSAAAINPKTCATWIPKPIGGRYDLNATILGVLAWMVHREQHSDAVPRLFNTIGDFNDFAHWKPPMLDSLRKKNPACVRPGSRPDLVAILQTLGEMGMENFDVIDGAYELNRLNRARADEQEVLNAEKAGTLLWSLDQKRAVSELLVEQYFTTQFLIPWKNAIAAAFKRAGGTLTWEQFLELQEKHDRQLPAEKSAAPTERKNSK